MGGVLATSVGRWGVRHALGRPGTWGLLVAAALVAPLGSRLSPLGDVGADPAWALAGAWAVPLALLGVVLALATLSHHEAFLALLPRRARFLGALLCLVGAAAGLQLVLGLGAALSSGPGAGLPPLVPWLAVDLHLAALATILLGLPASGTVRATGIVGLAWVLPALLDPSAPWARLRPLVDAGWTRSALADGAARGAASVLFLLAALLGAGFLLASAPPSPHPGPR